MKTILIILCLIPTLALAETKLNFKDKTTMCGAYELKGNQYCKSMSGGEMCWNKADIASVEKTDECEQGGYAQGNTGAATAANSNGTGNDFANGNCDNMADKHSRDYCFEMKKASEEGRKRIKETAERNKNPPPMAPKFGEPRW
jgi:hypothetical protein